MLAWFKSWFYIKNCFFGAAKVTRNTDPDKYFYSGNDIGFEPRILHFIKYQILILEKNVVIFGVDNSCWSMSIIRKINLNSWRQG